MKIVVVSPHPVLPADSGDRIRTAGLLSGLVDRGIDVHLVGWTWSRSSASAPWPSTFLPGKPMSPVPWLLWRLRLNARRLKDPRAEYTMAKESASLGHVVEEIGPDVVDFQHSFTWVPTRIPDVCTFHNVESNLYGQLDGETNPAVQAVRSVEERVLASVRRAVAFSEVDAARARSLVPEADVSVVPIGFDPVGTPKSSHAPQLRRAVFVGTMGYEPNRQAARALIEIWPRLRNEAGLERVAIVGREAANHVTALDGVEVYSDVSSVAPYLTEADVLLVPLSSGGGVRVKIIEAFALGVPVVSTSVGIEGLAADDGVHAVIVDRPEAIVEGVQRLASAMDRERIAGAARELWRSTYSRDAMVDAMLDIYEQLRN